MPSLPSEVGRLFGPLIIEIKEPLKVEKMKMRKMFTLVFVALCFVSVFGCASKPQEKVRVFWPPLPDEPYMEWLGTYSSQDDFEKTAAEQALRDFLGQPKLQAFQKPTGIVGDSDRGLVYVADGDHGNVRVYNFKTKQVKFLNEDTLAVFPAGLATDSQKNIYITDAEQGQVVVTSSEGVPLRTFGKGVFKEKASQITINERLGRIYVTDALASNVVVFDLDGNHLFTFGQEGQDERDLYLPQGIAIDRDDRVFVADQLNARIQIFDKDGQFLSSFGERGDKFWNFEAPRGLAFDSEDNLWVLDARKAGIFVYSKEGRLLLYFVPGRKLRDYPLGLAFPNFIMIDQNDRVYLTDMVNQRFQVWQFMSRKYKEENPLSDDEITRQMKLRAEKAGVIW